MAKNAPITQFIGDPVVLFASTLTTDADKASDNLTAVSGAVGGGVPIAGYSGVLFIQVNSYTTDVLDVSKMVIQYSCDGAASNAADSNAGGWTNTDACFRGASDISYSSAARVSVIDIDLNGWEIGAFGTSGGDKNAAFFGATGAQAVATDAYFLIGIPYGHYKSPSTSAHLDGVRTVVTSTSIVR